MVEQAEIELDQTGTSSWRARRTVGFTKSVTARGRRGRAGARTQPEERVDQRRVVARHQRIVAAARLFGRPPSGARRGRGTTDASSAGSCTDNAGGLDPRRPQLGSLVSLRAGSRTRSARPDRDRAGGAVGRPRRQRPRQSPPRRPRTSRPAVPRADGARRAALPATGPLPRRRRRRTGAVPESRRAAAVQQASVQLGRQRVDLRG